jgi:nucleotide-binding universal stress UspA family protein
MTTPTVLVTLDGSPIAEAALPYGQLLAQALSARLELLSVLESPSLLSSTDGDSTPLERESYLQRLAAAWTGGATVVGTYVVAGTPSDAILTAAREPDVVAMVMATHGRGGLQRALIGSVADKIMRQSTVPVLLVRPSATAQPALRRLLVPLDGSPRAEAALPWAATLAAAAGASVLLVRAEAPMIERVPTLEYVPDFSDLDAAIVAHAEAYLATVRTQLPATLPVETRVVALPGLQLPAVATETGADLVVMTTRGQGGMRRVLVGSVADRMVRLGPPVFLVPAPDADEEEASREATAAAAARAVGAWHEPRA